MQSSTTVTFNPHTHRKDMEKIIEYCFAVATENNDIDRAIHFNVKPIITVVTSTRTNINPARNHCFLPNKSFPFQMYAKVIRMKNIQPIHFIFSFSTHFLFVAMQTVKIKPIGARMFTVYQTLKQKNLNHLRYLFCLFKYSTSCS